jgi:hypothetical protein
MREASETVDLHEIVRVFLSEAREGAAERRADKRESFFQPITLVLEDDPRRRYSCFSRDISATGIGLLHCMALEAGEVVLTIPNKSQGNVRIRSKIVWCRPCGEGWFLSGARFVEVLASK